MSEAFLVLDLRDRELSNPDDFWEAISAPLKLPDWFGRNLNAWHDTLVTGGISTHLDSHTVVIQVSERGIFAKGHEFRQYIVEDFAESPHAAIEVHRI